VKVPACCNSGSIDRGRGGERIWNLGIEVANAMEKFSEIHERVKLWKQMKKGGFGETEDAISRLVTALITIYYCYYVVFVC